jgi:hypothetical protein
LAVKQQLSGSKSLPTASAAQTHFTNTLQCVHSGGFAGHYSGSDTGNWGMLVLADGKFIEISYSTKYSQYSSVTGKVSANKQGNLTGAVSAAGGSVTGLFNSVDNVSGTWQLPSGAGSGTWDGVRTGGASSAKYRYTGFHTTGFFTVDIDANNKVSGLSYVLADDKAYPVTGTVNGNIVTGTTSNGSSYSVTLGSAPSSSGTYSLGGSYTNGTYSGVISGSGCQLNP